MKRLMIIALISAISAGNCFSQAIPFDSLYLGQTPPGNTPILFAPGIISFDNRNESMITFSPDGKECYYTEHEYGWNDWCKIWGTVYKDNAWSNLQEASFTNDYSMSPSISSDGTQLFFASFRSNGMDVFQCLRTTGGGWSAPVKMNSEISSTNYEFSCHPSNLGNMFVCSWRSGGVGGCDGWRIPNVNGQYQKAENLGVLNSKVGDCVWAPGPNEEYLVFQSNRSPVGKDPDRIGGFFKTDLFITFAMSEGEWSVPQNIGPTINSDSTDGNS